MNQFGKHFIKFLGGFVAIIVASLLLFLFIDFGR